jgi:hypothetical protein
MIKVADTRQQHRHLIFIDGRDNLFIADGTARLNDSGDACFCRGMNIIIEREERIGSHDRALRRKTRFTGLDGGDTHRIHTAHLSGANTQRRRILHQHLWRWTSHA